MARIDIREVAKSFGQVRALHSIDLTVEDRELAAATLQVLAHDRSINPVLLAGEPLQDASGLAGRLRSAMAGLMHDGASQ